MSARNVVGTASRVLSQLRRDPRTVAMLLATPVILLTLMRWVFEGQPAIFQRVGIPLVGIFPLTSMFMVTSVTMLRERTTGTLERLMTLPIAKVDLLAGYALAFGLVAVLQGTIAAGVAFGLLGLETDGPVPAVVGLAVLNALLGLSLGLLVSAFARSEFQAVQFMPALLFPQMLLSGILAPRETMARALEWVSAVLPMTYAYDALARIGRPGGTDARLAADIAVLAGVTLGALLLGSATLRRRTG